MNPFTIPENESYKWKNKPNIWWNLSYTTFKSKFFKIFAYYFNYTILDALYSRAVGVSVVKQHCTLKKSFQKLSKRHLQLHPLYLIHVSQSYMIIQQVFRGETSHKVCFPERCGLKQNLFQCNKHQNDKCRYIILNTIYRIYETDLYCILHILV